MAPREADPTVWLEIDSTAAPSPIRFGFTDQRLTAHGGLIVGTDLRAIWLCGHGAFGEIALPRKRA
jgi:hypothetical protein